MLFNSLKTLQETLKTNKQIIKDLFITKTTLKYNTYSLPDENSNNLLICSLLVYFTHLNIKHNNPNKPWGFSIFEYNSLYNSTQLLDKIITDINKALDDVEYKFTRYLLHLKESYDNYIENSKTNEKTLLNHLKQNFNHLKSEKRYSLRIGKNEFKQKLKNIKKIYKSNKVNNFQFYDNKLQLFNSLRFTDINLMNNSDDFEFLKNINKNKTENLTFFKENENNTNINANKIETFFEEFLNDYKADKNQVENLLNGNKLIINILEKVLNNKKNTDIMGSGENDNIIEKEVINDYNENFGVFHSYLAKMTDSLFSDRKQLRNVLFVLLKRCDYIMYEAVKEWVLEAKRISLMIKENIIYQQTLDEMIEEYKLYMRKVSN